MDKLTEHSCKENMQLDGEYTFSGDSMIFWGECSVCGKKLSELFNYVDTRDLDNNIIK